MSETATPTKVGPTADGKVNVMLAHPLNVRDLVTLGLDPDTKSGVNDVIEITTDQAVGLISAGFVQVDPDDRVAVTNLVHGEKKAAEVMPLATEGNTNVADLKGDDLDAALTKRGLPVEGKADEKRAAVARFDATAAQG